MSFRIVHFMAPFIIASLLVSCTASQHAGVVNVKEPSLSELISELFFHIRLNLQCVQNS